MLCNLSESEFSFMQISLRFISNINRKSDEYFISSKWGMEKKNKLSN
jgi:hypothetical protein